MTPERFAELDANGAVQTATLTPAELALGWHFCLAFDGMLTSGEPVDRDTPNGLLQCACGNTIKPHTRTSFIRRQLDGTYVWWDETEMHKSKPHPTMYSAFMELRKYGFDMPKELTQ